MKIKNENNIITNEFKTLHNDYLKAIDKINDSKFEVTFKDYLRSVGLAVFFYGSIAFMLCPFLLLGLLMLFGTDSSEPITVDIGLGIVFLVTIVISITGALINCKNYWYTNLSDLYLNDTVWVNKKKFEEELYNKKKRTLLSHVYLCIKDNYPDYSSVLSANKLTGFVACTDKFKNFTGYDYLEFKETFSMDIKEFAHFCIVVNEQVRVMIKKIEDDNREYEERKKKQAELLNKEETKVTKFEDIWECSYCGNLNSGKDLRCPHCMGVRKKIV